MSGAAGSVGFQTLRYPGGVAICDQIAREEPLEIRVDGQPLAVLMRTPGADLALTRGFLLSEGLIEGPEDLRAVARCTDPAAADRSNVVLATLATGATLADLEARRRRFTATSSCGLCGATSLAQVFQTVRPFDAAWPMPEGLIQRAAERAHAGQALFAETGGIHSAALFALNADSPSGPVHQAEDIGRHNAVDKCIGALLERASQGRGAWPPPPLTLWVSGRGSFELVQKAVLARLRGLICVGAPSSLAVELARQARLTLVGFARDGRFNVYAGRVLPRGE